MSASFIVFEGLDGSGKTTQARGLFRKLRQQGYPALLTHEPGGTPLGESLRRWLKRQSGLSPLSELFLFVAARAQFVKDIVRPNLEAGVNVIGDRYIASTVAYQGYGRGLDLALVEQLNQTATGGLRPDLTVLLDLPVADALARKHHHTSDVFDTAPVEFRCRVRSGYLAQAGRDPDGWLVLDGGRPVGALSRHIWAKVQPLLCSSGKT